MKKITLQQFRSLQLPRTLQRAGQGVGVVGVLCWFWWVLFEKGFLQVLLTGAPDLQVILMGLPLLLILPALFYTALFILLRVVTWLFFSPESREPEDPENPPAL